MFEYQIRPVEVGDHQKVIDLLQAISEYSPDDEMLDEVWQAFIAQPHLIAMVAVASADEGLQSVIGYGSVCLEVKIRGGAMGHIEDVVVDARFHGQGVGSAIVDCLIAEATFAGCYKISLECRAEKESFYARLGFQTTGQAMSKLMV